MLLAPVLPVTCLVGDVYLQHIPEQEPISLVEGLLRPNSPV
jgi:hypothetical protein